MTATVSYLPTADAPAESPSEQFARLYAQNAHKVRALLRRMSEDPSLAEDMTQDVFADLWAQISSPKGFDEQAGSVLSLLFSRARWGLYHHWQRLAKQREYAMAPDDYRMAHAPEPTAGPDVTVPDRLEVGQVLSLLDPEQRRAVALYYLEGIPAEDIAALAKVTSATVYNRLIGAKAILREHYGLPAEPKPADASRARREAAAKTYRASLAAGRPLTLAQLANQYGASTGWAKTIADSVRPPVSRGKRGEGALSKTVLQLRTRLAEGAFPTDAPLPKAGALGEQIGATASVVSKALVKLAAEGVIERRGPSSGVFVAYYPTGGTTSGTTTQPTARPEGHRAPRPRLALAGV